VSGAADSGCTIKWHHGPRAEVRDLFELAEDSREQLDGYIDLGQVIVALDATGEIVGHLQLIPSSRDDVTEIKGLAVREGFRRRGVGRQLVERAVAECRGNQVGEVTVATAAADIDNLRFYQRCGFRPESVEQDAFTPAKGYPPHLSVDGIPVRDSIRFTIALEPRSAHTRLGRNDTNETRSRHMVTKGLIVRLEAKAGREDDLAAFLHGALPLVQEEPQTVAWFAVRSAASSSSFAIVDVFPDDEGRQAHLDGAVAAALVERANELLAESPAIEHVDVLAAKLP